MRRWRSWIALAALGITVVIVLAVQAFRPAQAQDGTVLKVYPCPAGQAAIIADRLRDTIGAVEGVRVAADSGASQVVVQAPREVQAWVAQQLADRGEGAATASDAGAPANAPKVRTVALLRSTPRQIETALSDLLAYRLGVLPSSQDALRKLRVTAEGQNAEVSIDSASSQVKISGPASLVDPLARVVQVLDGPAESGRSVRLMPLHTAHLEDIQRATSTIQTVSNSGPVNRSTLAYYQAKPREDATTGTATPTAVGQGQTPPVPAPAAGAQPPAATGEGAATGLINPVQIESIPGVDVLVIKGRPEDVARVQAIIREVEAIAALTKPEIRSIPVKNVDCEQLAIVIQNVYTQVYQARQGNVSITPIVTPNELLVVGRKENVATVKELADKLDQPTAPETQTQFQVFYLHYIPAATAQTAVTGLFPIRAGSGLAPVVNATVDARSNSLIVQASPRDMEAVKNLFARLDVASGGQMSEVRWVKLEHALASDVAAILQSAIGVVTGGPTAQQGGFGTQPTQPAAGTPGAQARTEMVRLMTARGSRLVSSALLSDVKISTDPKANALIITAPPEDMELLVTLIHEIDQIPAENAQIKVFTDRKRRRHEPHPNAPTAFRPADDKRRRRKAGARSAVRSAALQQVMQTVSAGGEVSVVPLHFAVDVRTNSIIATGTEPDLNVVEAVLTKLDTGDVRLRKTFVMRLKNSQAADVANTVNTYLTTMRQFDLATPGLTSMYEEFEREVIVVPGTGDQQHRVQRHASDTSTRSRGSSRSWTRGPRGHDRRHDRRRRFGKHGPVRHRAGPAGFDALRPQHLEQHPGPPRRPCPTARRRSP